METSHLALSDNGFLFDSRNGATYGLNATGTYLLRRMIDGTPSDELPDALIEAFDVTVAEAERDVEQFLLRLADLRLFEDEAEELGGVQ